LNRQCPLLEVKRTFDWLPPCGLVVIADASVVECGRICGIVWRGKFKGLEINRLDDETGLWECIR